MRNKIYTKAGDRGETSIIGGEKVSKSAPRLEAYGSIDELNAALGFALSIEIQNLKSPENLQKLRSRLGAVQNQLFNVGSQLACADSEMRKKLPQVHALQIQALENDIDEMDKELPELKEFILPGGTPLAAALHLARTICRRAERNVVSLNDKSDGVIIEYLNRLGDYLFVAARYANFLANAKEIKWKKD